ncbi:hypothetical protein FQN52_001233 [Onygenales sp. PD_12]|nr:hypothetical protein FQN52_001233 [Onygenales sp. PD_12]
MDTVSLAGLVNLSQVKDSQKTPTVHPVHIPPYDSNEMICVQRSPITGFPSSCYIVGSNGILGTRANREGQRNATSARISFEQEDKFLSTVSLMFKIAARIPYLSGTTVPDDRPLPDSIPFATGSTVSPTFKWPFLLRSTKPPIITGNKAPNDGAAAGNTSSNHPITENTSWNGATTAENTSSDILAFDNTSSDNCPVLKTAPLPTKIEKPRLIRKEGKRESQLALLKRMEWLEKEQAKVKQKLVEAIDADSDDDDDNKNDGASRHAAAGDATDDDAAGDVDGGDATDDDVDGGVDVPGGLSDSFAPRSCDPVSSGGWSPRVKKHGIQKHGIQNHTIFTIDGVITIQNPRVIPYSTLGLTQHHQDATNWLNAPGPFQNIPVA